MTSVKLICKIKFYAFSCITVTTKTNKSQRLLAYHPYNSQHSGKKLSLNKIIWLASCKPYILWASTIQMCYFFLIIMPRIFLTLYNILAQRRKNSVTCVFTFSHIVKTFKLSKIPRKELRRACILKYTLLALWFYWGGTHISEKISVLERYNLKKTKLWSFLEKNIKVKFKGGNMQIILYRLSFCVSEFVRH